MKKKNYLLLFPVLTLLFIQCSPGQIHNINERNKIRQEYGLKSISDAQREQIVKHTTDSLRQIDSSLTFVKIPNKLNIKDKVIISNKTPNPIKQIAITVINDNGQCVMLGQGTNIDPGASQELLNLDGNALKTIRKRTLVIKIKNTDSKQYSIKLSEQQHDLHIDVTSNSIFDF